MDKIKEKLEEIYNKVFTYYYWGENIRNPFAWMRDKKHELKNLWLRYTRGVGCCDLFSYDGYIAKVMARDLRIFKAKNFAYPGDDEFKTFEDWQNYIQEIIDGLDSFDKIDWDAKDCFEQENKARLAQDEAMMKFAKRFSSFWI